MALLGWEVSSVWIASLYSPSTHTDGKRRRLERSQLACDHEQAGDRTQGIEMRA